MYEKGRAFIECYTLTVDNIAVLQDVAVRDAVANDFIDGSFVSR